MTFTSDNQERELIEAHIREAHEMRADYMGQIFKSAINWVADAFEPVKVQLTRENMGGLGHTFKDEVLP